MAFHHSLGQNHWAIMTQDRTSISSVRTNKNSSNRRTRILLREAIRSTLFPWCLFVVQVWLKEINVTAVSMIIIQQMTSTSSRWTNSLRTLLTWSCPAWLEVLDPMGKQIREKEGHVMMAQGPILSNSFREMLEVTKPQELPIKSAQIEKAGRRQVKLPTLSRAFWTLFIRTWRLQKLLAQRLCRTSKRNRFHPLQIPKEMISRSTLEKLPRCATILMLWIRLLTRATS